MKHILIMGGTFDPIHNGHLIAAQTALDMDLFDEVLFMPTGNPPHKSSSNITSFEHRFAMCELAIIDSNGFKVSNFEATRKGKIYSADTFELLSTLHKDHKYYMILGTDAVMGLDSWYKPEKLLTYGSFVVVERGGYDHTLVNDKIEAYTKTYGTTFVSADMPRIELSSSDIRRRVKDGLSINYRAPERVIDYINRNDLYK